MASSAAGLLGGSSAASFPHSQLYAGRQKSTHTHKGLLRDPKGSLKSDVVAVTVPNPSLGATASFCFNAVRATWFLWLSRACLKLTVFCVCVPRVLMDAGAIPVVGRHDSQRWGGKGQYCSYDSGCGSSMGIARLRFGRYMNLGGRLASRWVWFWPCRNTYGKCR